LRCIETLVGGYQEGADDILKGMRDIDVNATCIPLARSVKNVMEVANDNALLWVDLADKGRRILIDSFFQTCFVPHPEHVPVGNAGKVARGKNRLREGKLPFSVLVARGVGSFLKSVQYLC